MLRPGRNCWRLSRATRAAVIVDADAYFRAARRAMLLAKRQILLIGWDFDARIALTGDATDHPEAPREVGALLSWLVEHTPELDIHVLRWDVGAISTLAHGRTLARLVQWQLDPQIHVKLDHMHPPGASHHQKIVVIDDCLAFCGGIDMTRDRWDTRDHVDDDPRRVEPSGTPYGPWHDATTALEGPVARALGELCRNRWRMAGGGAIEAPEAAESCWPEGLPVAFTDAQVAIARSYPALDDRKPVREIEQLYIDMIERAERWIYIENQYFASRRIAEAIARRLDEPDGPEIVIVSPLGADGWLEAKAMDTARARVVQALQRRRHPERLRLYHPVTAGGAPIYVHAKIMIVDDRVLRVGSSNLNNRSMRLDTECDMAIDAADAAGPDDAATIAGIRHDLIAEHLGVTPAQVAKMLAKTRSLIATIDGLRGDGRRLNDYVLPELGPSEKWLADNEILDPEGAEEMFEPLDRRGLLRALNPARSAVSGRPPWQLALGAGLVAAGAAGLTYALLRRRK